MQAVSKKRREHHEEHIDESWLIPYSDLLTLLLALFIVMYAMSAVDAQKFQEMKAAFSVAFNSGGGGTGILDENGVAPQGGTTPDTLSEDIENLINKDNAQSEGQAQLEQQKLEQLQDNINQYIQLNGLSDLLNTELNHSELKITINDSALFDSGKADLKEDAKQLAIKIGDMIESYEGYQIVISGHTDNVPIKTSRYESNWDLSSARALAFMKVVLSESALDPKQFQAVGMGEFHPIASNDTVEGKAKNRRVEISILRKFATVTPNSVITP